MGVRLNAAGFALIKEFEGFHPEPYEDFEGNPTIGYGHLITGNERFTRLSLSQAEHLLREDVANVEWYLKKYVTVELNEYQWAALVSWTFNLGPNALLRSSLLKKLNAGDYAAVPREMKRWNKATNKETKKKVVVPGLTRRREAEAFLWQRDMVPNPKPLTRSRTIIGSAVAGVSTTLTAVSDSVSEIVNEGRPLIDNLEIAGYDVNVLKIILGIIAMVGVGIAIWARISDRRSGKN